MKLTPPTLAQLSALPLLMRAVIPPDYLDANGHMNVRHYLTLFDEAGYPMYDALGLTEAFVRTVNGGGFDHEHHISYLNEVREGDTLGIYLRMLARTAKRMHYLMFMVIETPSGNETRRQVASVFECVNSFADLSVRRTAPWPDVIAAQLDVLIAQHSALDWPPPVCGVMSA